MTLGISDTQVNNTAPLCWEARLICCYAEFYYAECRYAECRYAECHYAECRYDECRGPLKGGFASETKRSSYSRIS